MGDGKHLQLFLASSVLCEVSPATLLGLKKQLSFVKKKGDKGVDKTGDELPVITAESAKQKPFKVYFPGPDYVPMSYGGRIVVLRARRQPRNRIRDHHLGWGKLAKGGVDVHFIPGDHGNVLKEPHVQGLAAALKKCLHSEQNRADSGTRTVDLIDQVSPNKTVVNGCN